MVLNRERVTEELIKFMNLVFNVSEVRYIRVQGVEFERQAYEKEKLELAIERSYHDCFSDVDMHIGVALPTQNEEELREYKRNWIEHIGIQQKDRLGCYYEPKSEIVRCVLKNGMRYDIGYEFYLDENRDSIRYKKTKIEDNPDWPIEKIERFWFNQILALGKLYRKDYLLSDSCANTDLSETLLQQRVLRNIKHGKTSHRYGYGEELLYKRFMNKCVFKSDDSTFNEVADKIYAAALAYDELIKNFYPIGQERSGVFFEIWESYDNYK